MQLFIEIMLKFTVSFDCHEEQELDCNVSTRLCWPHSKNIWVTLTTVIFGLSELHHVTKASSFRRLILPQPYNQLRNYPGAAICNIKERNNNLTRNADL